MRWMMAAALAPIVLGNAHAAPPPGDARLQVIAKPWVKRFEAERLVDGYGSGRGDVMTMDMLVTEAEYREIAQQHGWPKPPAAINLKFSRGVSGDAWPANLRSLVRIFPHSDRALGLTHEAALGGRIVVRDGCLYVTGRGLPDRLAYFPREFGLARDPRGHLAIRSRLTGGKVVGKIGDNYIWGGPIDIRDGAPMVAELRAKCGNAPIEHVGMLVTEADFRRHQK